MRKDIINGFYVAFGICSGTAIYQYLFTENGDVDFYKSVFIGAFVFVAFCIVIFVKGLMMHKV
ncbi:hypothetical protein AB6E05_24050 [Vibrio alginolyticus]|uniref:hypothetical protein n=1 Tax=Vibrio alginolyticus TaxID=663 RepID=UPI00354C721D